MHTSNVLSLSVSTTRPTAIAKLRDLRVAIRITAFITDGDTRTMFLELVDAIAADLGTPIAAERSVR
jgi:hypothetical protein